MPLRLGSLTKPGDIAALNRWADYIETKLRGAINDTSFVNALGERAISAAANATGASFKGNWSSTVTYTTGAQVNYNGNTWAALQTNTNQTPASGPYWTLVGPSTLDNVADGTSRLARTSAHSSYRPLSNPLTAIDAGSSATINVAAFTMRSAGTDISVNGGSLTGLSYSTLYYVYYDDPNFAGGAVTYVASTSKTDPLNSASRFYVGSILTPPATGAETFGNNDGGTGAQIGLQGDVWGTAINYSGTGSSTAWVNPTHAIDGNSSTYAYISSANAQTAMILSGFNGIAPVYSSIVLNVRTQITGSVALTLTLDYSTDGGKTFTTIYAVTGGSRALTTDTVTLPSTQSIALVQVRFTWGGAGTSSGEWNIYGAWLAVAN